MKLTLDGRASGEPDAIESLSWTQTAGPSATVVDAHQALLELTMPAVDAIQTLSFTLKVIDKAGRQTEDDVAVQVAPPWLGQAKLGPIAGGAVRVHAVTPFSPTPLHETTTPDSDTLSEVGRIDLRAQSDLLDPEALYLVVVEGGSDVDADDNGVRDAEPTAVSGRLHALFSGEQLLRGNFRVSALTEVAYQRARHLIAAEYPQTDIQTSIDTSAQRLIIADLSADGRIDAEDLGIWDAAFDGWAYRRGPTELAHLIDTIHQGGDVASASLALTSTVVHEEMFCDDCARGMVGSKNLLFDLNSFGRVRSWDLTRIDAPRLLHTLVIETAGKDPQICDGVDLYEGVLWSVCRRGVLGDFRGHLVGTRIDAAGKLEAIGELDLGSTTNVPYGLAFANGHAFVAAPRGQLLVIDASDAAHPAELASITVEGEPSAIVAGPLHVYVASNNANHTSALHAIDVSDPNVPRQTAKLDLDGLVYRDFMSLQKTIVSTPYTGKAGSGYSVAEPTPQRMYVVSTTEEWVDQNARIHTISLSEPAQPRIEGMHDRRASPLTAPRVFGERLYLGDRVFSLAGVELRDLGPSPAYQPNRRATIDWFRGEFGLVNTNETLHIVDLTDDPGAVYERHGVLLDPKFGEDPLGGMSPLSSNGAEIYVQGSVPFGGPEFARIDVSKPFEPELAATSIVGSSTREYGALYEGRLHGCWHDVTLDYLSIEAPDERGVLKRLGSAVFPNTWSSLRCNNIIATAERTFVEVFAYRASPKVSRLFAFDTRDPQAPRSLGSVPNTTYTLVGAKGPVAYYAGEAGALLALDTSDPDAAEPTSVPTGLSGTFYSLTVAGDLASAVVITKHGQDLVLLDVSEPTAPRELSRMPNLVGLTRTAWSGDRVYVPMADKVLVIDATDPTKPVLEHVVATHATWLESTSDAIYALFDHAVHALRPIRHRVP